MSDTSEFGFGPFRLDLTRGRLWRGQDVIELRAKPLAVLRYLLEHPEQVVTRDELQQPVWAETYVTKSTLRVSLREIRRALGDSATAPQYIETVGRQGYRFIAPVSTIARPVISRPLSVGSSAKEGTKSSQREIENWPRATHFVGRQKELAQLHQWLESVRAGNRQLVFVTGEPGIGKTTLVNTFLSRAQEAGRLWIVHGQCVEQYGVGAPYLPLLGALGRLCQQPGAEHLVHVFERHAPVWLAQLPTLLSQEQRRDLSLTAAGATPAHMLRELGEVLVVLSAERPLVLVLEDLHWSDSATVEALAYLARRREPARLLLLGTYRPANVVTTDHQLRRLIQELLAHELCNNLALELLSEQDVKEYVTQRLAGNPLAAELSPVIYRRTEGNALFVVNVVDYLLRQDLIRKVGDQRLTSEVVVAIQLELPKGLQHLILKEVEGLSLEEQRVLEAASVAGLHFTAAEVAAADQSEEGRIEAVCDGLVRQLRLIEARGTEEWSDGTITAGYQFQHAVYQQVVGSRVGQARQVRLHRLVGERLEVAYGAQAAEIASHLAIHFEQGRDLKRAIHYRRQAAEHALRQSAYQEMYLHSTAGLALLETLPDTPERKRLELGLRQLVNTALLAARGFMDAELEESLQRTQQLCQEPEDDTALVSALVSLGRLCMVRAIRAAVAEIEQKEEYAAKRIQDPRLLVQLHTHLMAVATFRGLHVRAAERYQHVFENYDPKASSFFLPTFGGDPLVMAFLWSGMSLSLAGQLDQGWSRVAQALARAEELNQPFTLVNVLLIAAMVKLLRGNYDEALRLAQKMDALTHEYPFPVYRLLGPPLQGSIALQSGALEEGIAGITTGLAEYRATGLQLHVPFFLSFLAEGYRQQGQITEALQVVNEALSLTATNLDVYWEAELYRLKGELLLNAERGVQNDERKTKKKGRTSSSIHHSAFSIHRSAEVEACFQQAVEIARQQGAKLLELRAVTSLARLWHQQGKAAEAQQKLAEIYNWFTEGFDTVDLQTARTMLAEWSVSSKNTAQSPRQQV